MFHLKCTKCCGKSMKAGSNGCSYCNGESNPCAGMYVEFHLKQPKIEIRRETGETSASKNYLVPNIMPLDLTVKKQNREEDETSYQIMKNFQEVRANKPDIMPLDLTVKKQNREEDGIRYQIMKNLLEVRANKPRGQEIGEKKDRNCYLMHDTSPATNLMPSGSCHPVDQRKALLNNECHWNICQFKVSQKVDFPVNNVFWNDEYRREINKFQVSQMYDSTVKSAHSIGSVREDAHSNYDFPAIPGPSRYGNQDDSNVLNEILKFTFASIIRKKVPRRIITCLYCGESIHKHSSIHSKKKEYFCCVCTYKTSEKSYNLQVHIRIHCSKYDCNKCSKEYTEGTSHVGLQKCRLCFATFDCRSQLEEHLLELHLKHFRENCWECFEPIIAHHTIKEGKELFFCCMCGYETNNVKIIRFHNEVHRPKYFCKICGEEYTEKLSFYHNDEYSCFVCKKQFQCRKQLEDHYEDFYCSEYFIENCRLCKGIINKHTIDRDKGQYYECCVCHDNFKSKCKLQNHLHTHTGLKFFKCGECGERYRDEGCRNNHSKICVLSRFSCEVCRARFPSDYSLNKHYLGKHRQTT